MYGGGGAKGVRRRTMRDAVCKAYRSYHEEVPKSQAQRERREDATVPSEKVPVLLDQAEAFGHTVALELPHKLERVKRVQQRRKQQGERWSDVWHAAEEAQL